MTRSELTRELSELIGELYNMDDYEFTFNVMHRVHKAATEGLSWDETAGAMNDLRPDRRH